MPNILPETEVRGSLLVDILQAKGKGYICQQTSGSLSLTMEYILTAWANYVNGSVSGIVILNFESMRVPVVLLCVAVAF